MTTSGAWDRADRSAWARRGHLLIQGSLVAVTVVALTDGTLSAPRSALVAALAATLLGWHALMAFRWRYWQLPRARFAAAMLAATGLWVPLLFLHGAFGLTVIAAYAVAACPFLARAATSVAVLTVVLIGVSAADGRGPTPVELVGLVLTSVGVVVVHGLIGRIHHQNVEQSRLIGDLRSTRAELARREHEAGVLAERERLARDIHDSLAQGFTSIVMLLEAADAQLDPSAVDVRARIDQARQAARDHLGEARRVVWSLRPGPLAAGALTGALEVLLRSGVGGSGVDARLEVHGEPRRLHPDQEVVLYRAAQEALANVVRHAGASRVVCTLSFLDDETILDVNDDGHGFTPGRGAPRPGGGLGLVGLGERVEGAGGFLHVETSPSAGTNVTVRLPTSSPDLSAPSARGSLR